MEAKDLFVKATECAGTCIHRIEPADLGKSTPCTEWNLKALVNHMVYELLWVPDLLAGKTVAEVGNIYEGDVLGDDVQRAWEQAVDAALEAVNQVDPATTVHLSYADKSAKDYIVEIGGDILVHGWDVGQSLQCSIRFDEDLAKAVYDAILPRKEEFANSGLFGTPVDVPENASNQAKLLAIMGRKDR